MSEIIVAMLAEKLSGAAIISADINDENLKGIEIDSLALRIESYFEGKEGVKILTKEILAEIIKKKSEEKTPMQIEIVREGSFKPAAKDVQSDFKIRKFDSEGVKGSAENFADYFRDRFSRIKKVVENGRASNMLGMLRSIDSIKQYTDGREVTVIGMVYDKIITKNGNLMFTLEDETGTTKILFTKSDDIKRKALFETARKLVIDDIVAVKGRISGPWVLANTLLWPDIPIKERKKSEDDIAIAFLSDIHVGSKLFMEKNFLEFIRWINGGIDYKKDLAGKIKYVVLGGDLADGIGVYPNQDKELQILDIYKQYSYLMNLVDKIPDYIEIFLMPGNHDAVRTAEPQPCFSQELLGDFKKSNVHMIANPNYVDIHGLKTLSYHGASLDSIIREVPGCSYAKPEVGMIEILKRRHLSPIYGRNMIIPTKTDFLVIDEVPDILYMGHVHKNAAASYHGTLLINSGTWQSQTQYEAKQGHIPSPAILPVYETKNAEMTQIDFNSV